MSCPKCIYLKSGVLCVVYVSSPPSVPERWGVAGSGTVAPPGPQRGRSAPLAVPLKSLHSGHPLPHCPAGCWTQTRPLGGRTARLTRPPRSEPAAGTGSAPGTCFAGAPSHCCSAHPLWWSTLWEYTVQKHCGSHLWDRGKEREEREGNHNVVAAVFTSVTFHRAYSTNLYIQQDKSLTMTLHAHHTHQRAHKLTHTKLQLHALWFTVSAEILGLIENAAFILMTPEGRTKPIVVVFNETTTENASSAT